MTYIVSHHIAGEKINDKTLKTQPLYNPATGKPIGYVELATKQLCEKAVFAAKQAGYSWATTPPIKRARLLFTFRELLEKNQHDLACLITQEHGKTREDAKGSIARAIELIEFHCGLASQLQGHFSANVSTQMDCHTYRQPLGICAGVSPFNFPVMVPMWMIIPAIACGNTFILKPSEQAPSAAVRLIELLYDAGLPPGVVNCIHGDKTTVSYLLEHPEIQAFTAVASTPVAESIYHTAIASGKRAHTFGGAKNHCVVMPDANLNHAANAIVGAAYGSAGERCMALSVVIAVGNKTADRLIEKLRPLIQAIRIDAGDVPETDMGPLISYAHRERIVAAIHRGVEEGATLVIDGRRFRHPTYPDGYYLGPTLFDKVNPSMFIYQQELFGPVLLLLRVDHLEEALQLINTHQYGNGTAIFTRDGYSARLFTERVQAGMVGINVPIPVPIASHPFGGWKRSFFGDTSMHGQESIHFYTKLKTVTSKWPETDLNHPQGFTMPTHNE